MCLAIPSKIVSKKGDTAVVDVYGVQREANLMLCPEAKVGDYIIMHAGFAIHILDKKDAEETLQMFKDIENMQK
ncbi:MAG: HypC/HybG/HupF family hydrogenase formation chaperone [Candidatus Latescibacteria bacterium]|nr:HypC/HybG/HupF family hydrogenase formation chaperone [Candidatus Latescibacterota bacterium]